MVLLRLGLAGEEQPRLAVVVGEAFRSDAQLLAFLGRGEARIAAVPALMLDVGAQAGRLVVDLARAARPSAYGRRAGDCGTGICGWLIGNLVEVGAAQALELGILIGEEPALQQRIVGEVDARHDIGRAEGDLLGFGEEIGRDCGPAPCGPPRAGGSFPPESAWSRPERRSRTCRPGSWVKVCRQNSHSGKVALVDGIPEIAAMEVRIGAIDLHALRPRPPTARPVWAANGT